ncbi:SURF1 family cytochrome oxidase biogenesis protein [Gryllotalpicola ginsengisoli]|uniref:SURF1 family cytochrome oxidase biogenesis protein n=1 Tax=Gryllotalpicola ginsengisoli TaxID=444608 RepID=UPI0003B5CD89|nr:SURF1 family protein [Gryllotalpicola ginsengisoli]
MRHWTFVFHRRWLAYFAAAVIFAVACGFLSNWQHDRGLEAQHANELVARNFDSDPVPLTSVLSSTHAYSPNQQWKRVTVTGVYDTADQYLVRNRANDSGPGLEVITPMRLADGSVFLVDRGWVPSPDSGVLPKSVPAPPSGTVTAVVRLQPSEPVLRGQSVDGHSVGTINLPTLAKLIGGDVYDHAYGQLDSETPRAANELTPVVSDPPVADTGMHWSYMIQWLIFAAIGFFGLGYAVRLEYRKQVEGDPSFVRRDSERDAARAARRAARRAKTDAAIEDQLLDAQGR